MDGTLPISGEMEYEVRTTPERFGAMPGRGEIPADPCYRVLHGADRPCPGCPALALGPGNEASRAVVRSRGPNGGFDVLSAQLVEPGVVRLHVWSVSDALVGELLQAKIAALATRSGLSERERTVLNLLVMGRSIHDIAALLGISARTVKFHQANVLDKLGADSRVDLMRLLV
jgi:DNA-binding CsgD family transcriptional regulator